MRRWLLTLLLFTATEAQADEPEGGAAGDSGTGGTGGTGGTSGTSGDSGTGGDGGSGIGPGEEKGTIGVGIVIGEPLGICGRLYVQDDQAIQAAVGVGFLGGGLQVHADYAFHPFILQSRDTFVLAAYVGPGVRVVQYADGRDASFFALGVRAVGGLLFDFKNPLDAFFEVAGVLEYGFAEGEGTGIAFNAGAGVRYYF